MALVGAPHRVNVAHEPDEWIEIRGIDYDERKIAKQAAFKSAVADMSNLKEAMAELEAMRGDRDTPEREPVRTREAVLAAWDWPTLFDFALLSWSYAPEKPPIWKGQDERTLEFIAATILERSGVDVPPLPGELSAEKNSSALSIAP